MEIFLPLLMLVLTIFVIVRTGALSPASIVCAFSTLSIGVFYYIVFDGGMDQPQAEGLSFAIGDYHQEAPMVMETYALLVFLTAVATLGLSKKSTTGSGTTGNYALVLLDRFLFSSAVPIIATVLFAATCLNMLLLSVNVGGSSLLHFLDAARPPLSIVTVCLLIYCWKKQSTLVISMLMLVFLYDFIFNMAFYSRFAPLAIVVATALIASKRASAGKSPFSISVALGAVLSVWVYLYALQGRGDRPGYDGLQAINLPFMEHYLLSVNTESSTFVGLLTNIFQGPMILAESVSNSTVTYESRYMFLSFSPFPAFLDGWKSVQGGGQFVNPVTPFNSFAELYYFGWPFIILFYLLFVTCIRILTRIYLQLGGTAGLLLTSPCVYALLCQHQYPLRLSLRLLYATTLIVYFISAYLDKQAGTSKSSNQVGILAYHPPASSVAVSAFLAQFRQFFDALARLTTSKRTS